MNTTDETIFTPQEVNDEMPQNSGNKTNKVNHTWKPVTIGGITGVMLGAAAMKVAEGFAENAMVSDDTSSDEQASDSTAADPHGVPVAEVGQDLSFGAAFAAAREQVGAGGVFAWHGNLYGTYTADEWAAMDSGQRQQFASDVKPLYSLAAQTAQTAPAEEQQTVTHTTSHTESHTTEYTTRHTTNSEDDNGSNHHVSREEPEVHFLGVESREIDGQTMNFGMARVGDINVALVDVDNDQVFDVRWADTNQNGEIERNELSDVSQSGMTVGDFASLAQAEQQANGAQTDQVAQQQEDLAPDMPDYMNDADTGLV